MIWIHDHHLCYTGKRVLHNITELSKPFSNQIKVPWEICEFVRVGGIMGETHCFAHSPLLSQCGLSLQNNLLSPERNTDWNGEMQKLMSYFLLQHFRVKKINFSTLISDVSINAGRFKVTHMKPGGFHHAESLDLDTLRTANWNFGLGLMKGRSPF